MIYWFTGQPGAGKTTIAKELITYLNNSKLVHVDGDDLRDIFKNKDYSENGRRKNIERAQDIARFMNEKGYTVIVSLVSPYKDQRETFKKENDVIEILVKTNEIRGREGFHVKEYDPPTDDYIELDTTNKRVDESFIELIKYIDL
jgi:adenylylsulfate kinase-like enzyme